jgi:putative GTP pyrophosphokinase
MPSNESSSELLDHYKENWKAFSGFMNNVIDFFQEDNKKLVDPSGSFVIHSVKSRMKDPNHLREKIARKVGEGARRHEGESF